MVARMPRLCITLTSIVGVVITAGCSAVDLEAGRHVGPESARNACLRSLEIVNECPDFGFGGAIPTPEDCQEFSDTEHCEAFSASVDCYDGIDICGLLAGFREGDFDQVGYVEFSRCMTDVMALDFDSAQCMPLFGLGAGSSGLE